MLFPSHDDLSSLPQTRRIDMILFGSLLDSVTSLSNRATLCFPSNLSSPPKHLCRRLYTNQAQVGSYHIIHHKRVTHHQTYFVEISIDFSLYMHLMSRADHYMLQEQHACLFMMLPPVISNTQYTSPSSGFYP